jgi:hypothetical protein
METRPTDRGAYPDPTLPTTEARSVWRCRIVVGAAVVFVVSLLFAVTAGLSRDTASFPGWWAPLAVGVAFLLGALLLAFFGLTDGRMSQRAEDASYKAYRILIRAIIGLRVVFFVWADRVVWPSCLTGLVWRYWLLPHGRSRGSLRSKPWLVLATQPEREEGAR